MTAGTWAPPSLPGLEFPGWRAEEIHAALGGTARSAETVAVLERVGAELKFGPAAASEFARRLEAVADPALLAEAGERVMASATADELLSGPQPA